MDYNEKSEKTIPAKKNRRGGVYAQRGYIFQTIIAMIECLRRDDWDSAKIEPETKNDKIDIMLYSNKEILSAIQVKSSQVGFYKKQISDCLEEIKAKEGIDDSKVIV